MLYGFVRGVARLLLATFYRRIEVIGLEHLPADGPLIVVANHHNGAVDGALLMSVIPRRLAPIVKAPLFHHPVLRFVLRGIGAIPVRRRQDAGSTADPERNAEMFTAASADLARGGGVLIFPEGTSHADPTLRPLRTGVARLALEAATTSSSAVPIVPVGLTFDAPATFRGGNALVAIGTPVIAAADDQHAVRTLTERVSTGLRRQMVEADDLETIRLAALVDRLWRGPARDSDPPGERMEWTRGVLRAARYLDRQQPGRLAALRKRLERYAEEIDTAGDAPESYALGPVVRRALEHATALIVGFPLALVGLGIHAVPYQLTGRLVRAARTDPDMEATAKLATGAVVYPLCWAAEAAVAAFVGGPLLFVAFVVALVPSGIVALTWQERMARARRDLRGLARFVLLPDRHSAFIERRRALIDELRALADAVPPEVPNFTPLESDLGDAR